ncbi:calcium/sodium antiporter [Clostridium sp. 'deep sea']|uniref:calcium/sodium antiporter n=1 Tax=Clostridium sp. 'deep sea' TaxID=2779445 RepID=UPI001896899C|nr:calcium/sodium antiporter [Clostridium sp. 'deep sea']QOR35816.1 calcium/sodium antiporter [Clostridium sp. 'deep sea']
MVPWWSFVGLIIGLVMIIKGADIFTDAAVWIAKKTGLPKVIIGVTIVSLATTLPEFAVSVFASYSGHASMAVGNAVGSCICNIGLILGLVLIIKQFKVERSGFVTRGIFMIIVGVVFFALSYDLTVSRMNGFVLFGFLALFIVVIYRELKNMKIVEKKEEKVEGTWGPKLLIFLVGSIIVVIGSRLVVNSGVTIAHFFNVPEIVISITLIALGTSLPELVTALTATFKGHQDLSLGNIIGADILNLTWVIGGASMANPLTMTKDNLYTDIPVMLGFMVLLFIFGLTKKRLGRLEGVVLFASYIAFMAFTIF